MAATTHWNALQYLGDFFLVGANSRRTPFVTMAGGLDGRGAQTTNSWQFPVASTSDLASPAQPAITETASLTAPTAGTTARTQDTNTCQIFQYQRSVSYAAQSDYATLSGLAVGGEPAIKNERDFQVLMGMKQFNQDAEYTFLNGAYQAATDAGTAAKMRGITAAISTNAVAASSAAMSKSLINSLLRSMAANGAQFSDKMVLLAGGLDIQRISEAYGYAPTDRNVGGVAIKSIYTDFCELGVVWDPYVASGTALVVDMSVCAPVFLPKDGEAILVEDLAKTGASDSVQIYSQLGLAYGPEEFHGKITGLATT